MELSKKQLTIAATWNIRTYVNVHIPTILLKIFKMGIPTTIIKLSSSFFINRFNVLSSCSQYMKRRVFNGLPQGSILSQLIFLIYISEVNRHIVSQAISLQYANDTLVYVKVKYQELFQEGYWAPAQIS